MGDFEGAKARVTAVSFYVATLYVGSAMGASLGGAAADHAVR
ncbi:hypothetical protein [Streptomyces sp. RB17]|nr:hypothetical protein [Streptomyces sp. RB17]